MEWRRGHPGALLATRRLKTAHFRIRTCIRTTYNSFNQSVQHADAVEGEGVSADARAFSNARNLQQQRPKLRIFARPPVHSLAQDAKFLFDSLNTAPGLPFLLVFQWCIPFCIHTLTALQYPAKWVGQFYLGGSEYMLGQ